MGCVVVICFSEGLNKYRERKTIYLHLKRSLAFSDTIHYNTHVDSGHEERQGFQASHIIILSVSAGISTCQKRSAGQHCWFTCLNFI